MSDYHGARAAWRQAYVLDLDGTLAVMHNRRSFDWHLVSQDKPNQRVIGVARALSLVYATPIATGRKECCREDTSRWIEKYCCEHAVGFCLCRAPMWMRQDDDNRASEIVKSEMMFGSDRYPVSIAAKYDVQGVFEDWGKVITMWRSHGLQVFDVGGDAPGA